MIPVLKVRDKITKKWVEILAIKGEKGDTPYIKEGYWWVSGKNTNVKAEGKDYTLTEDDKNEIAGIVFPIPTEADNGKYLRVIDGKAAWSDVPGEYGYISYDADSGVLSVT